MPDVNIRGTADGWLAAKHQVDWSKDMQGLQKEAELECFWHDSKMYMH